MIANQQPNEVSEIRPRLVKSEPLQKPVKTRIPWKKIAIYGVLAVAIFAGGLIPMWLKSNQHAAERDTAQRELRLKQMESLLAAAAIYAYRGDYEPARQMSSDFFTSLRVQIELGSESDLSSAQREKVKTLLAQRDDLITLLARSDPAAVQRLSDAYVAYRQATNDVAAHARQLTNEDFNALLK